MSTFVGTAPVNIALIKYWGKRDESLILPINSSLSITLSQQTLRARTKVTLSTELESDTFLLNGRCVPSYLLPLLPPLYCRDSTLRPLHSS